MNRSDYKTYTEQYLTSLPSMEKSARTITEYRRILSSFGAYLDQTAVETITTVVVIGWRAELQQTGIKSNTIKHYLVILRAFFEWCIRMEITNKNPVDRKELPKSGQIQYDLLSLDEILTLLHEAPRGIYKKTAIRNRAIILLLVLVGLRNSELRALTPSDLDFEHGEIIVRHGKGNKRRNPPFPTAARQAVAEYLNSGIRPAYAGDDAPLFGSDADENGHSTGGKVWRELSTTGLLGIVNRYTKNVCGHSVGVHSLRHAYASLCDHKRVPLRDIQISMGHSSSAVTAKIYIDVLDKSKAANTINAALSTL